MKPKESATLAALGHGCPLLAALAPVTSAQSIAAPTATATTTSPTLTESLYRVRHAAPVQARRAADARIRVLTCRPDRVTAADAASRHRHGARRWSFRGLPSSERATSGPRERNACECLRLGGSQNDLSGGRIPQFGPSTTGSRFLRFQATCGIWPLRGTGRPGALPQAVGTPLWSEPPALAGLGQTGVHASESLLRLGGACLNEPPGAVEEK